MLVNGTRTQSLFGNERTGPIIAGLLILGLMVACLATAALYRQSLPEQVDQDTINFTRSDYEQALAKWEARDVHDYTISVDRGGDLITIRVNRDTEEIYLLEWLRNGSPYEGAGPDPNNPVMPGLYRNLSVDGMLETAGQYLDIMEGDHPIAPPVGDTDRYNDFVARFDPEMGYPTFLANYMRSAHRSQELVWRSPVRPVLDVKNITVSR